MGRQVGRLVRKCLETKKRIWLKVCCLRAMDANIRILMVGGLGVCAVLFLGNLFRWLSEVNASHLPGREKLLRSPGESVRKNLEQLNEYLIYSVALFLLVPMLFVWRTPNLSNAWPLTFLILLMALSALPAICVVRLYRDYALGLRAERAVGEELNQLMLDGCHVFHDYPTGLDWHINHIVVGPSGVYVIQTKSTPKQGASKAAGEPEVIFDGSALKFPRHTCVASLDQARRSADTLRQQLSENLGAAPEVKPIVSLPGWRVVRHGISDVQVLNPKEIWQTIVTTGPAKLSASEIRQIAYRLQKKCRDVEI